MYEHVSESLQEKPSSVLILQVVQLELGIQRISLPVSKFTENYFHGVPT